MIGSDTKTREAKRENIEQDVCNVVVLGDHVRRGRCSGRACSVEWIPFKFIINKFIINKFIIVKGIGGNCDIWCHVRRC